MIKKVINFSLIGGIMTVFSLTINVLLLRYFHTPLILTYIFVYFSTISISYLLNSRYTFNSKISVRKTLIFFSIYIFSMLLGTLLYAIIPLIIKIPDWYYPFLVLPFTAASNFMLNHRFLEHSPQKVVQQV
jgi:putative flippase GtrA